MTRTIRGIAAALAIALLAGCAGTNFKRPEPQDLVVGKSNAADIQRVMGGAQQTGEGLQNEQKVQTLRYAYAEGAGQGRYPGVVPARAMVFTTHNELLVAQEFVSSFQADATEFDESKVGAIVKGKTTRVEVLALLGRPNGEAIYPVIKIRGDKALVYSYSHAKGNAFNMKFYNKVLIVSFNGDNLVSELQYTSNGDK